MNATDEIAFWACIISANVWSASSKNVWNAVFWVVLALVIRVPQLVRAIKALRAKGGKL